MKALKNTIINSKNVEKVYPEIQNNEDWTEKQIDVLYGSPNNPNTVSSYIGDEDGMSVDSVIAQGIYNMISPSHIDNLSANFIKITDHKAYINSIMNIALDPNTNDNDLVNAIEFQNKAVPFGPNCEGLVIPKNIYPDMYYAVSKGEADYYENSKKSTTNKTMDIKAGIINVLSHRFTLMNHSYLFKMARKTIDFFFESFNNYATRFLLNTQNKNNMTNEDIVRLGRSIELFGNNESSMTPGCSLFVGYISLSNRVASKVYMYNIKGCKGNEIDIYHDFENDINSEVMSIYDICESTIHHNLMMWYSMNGFDLNLVKNAELFNPADIETMALDALSKSLYYYKSDLYQAINALIVESVAYIDYPEGFKEEANKLEERIKARRGGYDDYDDCYYD